MSTPQTWLASLLAVQLLFASGLFAKARHHQQVSSQRTALLEFEKEKVDTIEIQDVEGMATLTKSEDGWRLPNTKSLPAKGSKIDDLLSSLGQLKQGWPVATTSSSHPRFGVQDEGSKKRVKLYQGEQLVAELLLGNSPGYRKIYVRKPNDNAVYAAKLNGYQFPCKDLGWFDKGLLALKDPTAIKGPDFEVKKQGRVWTLVDAAKGQELDTAATRQLAGSLSSIQVVEVADEIPEGAPVVIEGTGEGGTFRYEFIQQGDDYFLRRDDRKRFFSIEKGSFERITDTNLEKLLKTT